MKTLLTLWILTLSIGVGAAENLKTDVKTLSQKLEDKKYYYSALNEFFRETYNRPVTSEDVTRLEELLFFTGIELLDDYEQTLLDRYPTSSTRFILGRKAFQAKNYPRALEYFNKVHPGHRYYPEAKLLESQVYDKMSNVKLEFDSSTQCQKSAEKMEAGAPGEKIKRYYRMIYEICLLNKARHYYKEGDYKNALAAYDKIPKSSYKWPYILLEKAWVYYQLGDLNRTLGLLVTYKSPLLETYFFPEAEYLASLVYFRLCLYQDATTIISQYYQVYRPRFTALENVLKQNKSSQTYFYNLMFKPGDELKNHEGFVKQIITRLKKQTRFSLDFNSVYKINQEIKRINSKEKAGIKEKLVGHLSEVKENMVSKINYNAKVDIFEFLETVPFFSSELFKLNLEILAKKKDLVYGNKKLISDRSRGDYSNVQRSRFEYFWTFEGAFWADELGDYSLGLKSNCQTIRREGDGE